MRPFQAVPLTSLSRRPLGSSLRNARAIKRRPRPRFFSRAPPRPNQNADAQTVVVHNITSRSLGRRFLSLALYTATTITMFRLLGGKLADADDVQPDNRISPDLENNDDQESIFIALQYPKKLPRKFYRQSDPDWREFTSFSKNKSRKQAVLRDLAERVGRDIGKHPQISQALGKDIKLSRFWLDFIYPDSPPPEYARTGIEISDQYVALGTQVIPHSYYVQLSNILWPKAVFAAGVTSLHLFGRIQWIKLKNLCGWQLSPADKQIQVMSFIEKSIKEVDSNGETFGSARDKSDAIAAKVQQQLKDLEKSRDAASQPPTDAIPTATTSSTNGSAPSSSSSIWTALKRSRASSSSSDKTIASSPFLNWLPSPAIPKPDLLLKPLTSSTDLNIAWKAFDQVLQNNVNRSKMDLTPKGSFFVVGQVEVRGDRARLKADVQAAYDPQLAKFTYVIAKVTTVWQLSQAAKGGP